MKLRDIDFERFIPEITEERLWLAYFICALLTFGHAHNDLSHDLNPTTGESYEEFDVFIGGVFMGAAWPLYISVQLFKEEEEK